jgi:membrane protease YdiL (CAAX protease family)
MIWNWSDKDYFTVLLFATVVIEIGIIVPIISQTPNVRLMEKILLDRGSRTGVYSFITIVAAPILEELIFRGIILNGL